jgi:hypothetical protein
MASSGFCSGRRTSIETARALARHRSSASATRPTTLKGLFTFGIQNLTLMENGSVMVLNSERL